MAHWAPRTWPELIETDHRMVAVWLSYVRRIFGQHTLRLRICIPYTIRLRLWLALHMMYMFELPCF